MALEFKKVDTKTTWHDKLTVTVGNCFLTFSETTTGCGIYQMYGVSNISLLKDNEIKELLDFLEKLSNDKDFYRDNDLKRNCNTFMCTLGYWCVENNEPILKKLGFKEVLRFVNKAHGQTHKNDIQRIYFLTI